MRDKDDKLRLRRIEVDGTRLYLSNQQCMLEV
jgi:hypothetical protein